MSAATLKSLLCYLLLTSLLTLACGSRPIDKYDAINEKSECKVERVTMAVSFDGCEDACITVSACNGVCLSATTTISHPPFTQPTCTACQPVHYIDKRRRFRRVKVMCNGTETTQKVYWPRIKKCGCVSDTYQLY